MNTFLPALIGTALAIGSASGQSGREITLSEFRQTLLDYASVLDGRQGTEYYRKSIQNVPDSMLERWYQGVPDGKQFQAAGALIRSRRDAARALPRRVAAAEFTPVHKDGTLGGVQAAAPESSFSAGITSTPLPGIALFTPVFPSGSNWSNMVGALRTAGYLPGSGDLSEKNCSANDKSSLSVTVSTFQGVKDAADGVCEIIPDPLVVVLGEGTAVPAKEICYGVALIVGAFTSAFEGYLADCETQNALTSGAETEAAYFNTVALYNLKFRLKVEQNLQNTAAPIGLFELPTSMGGYLESARAIAANAITGLGANGVNITSATSALNQGDTYYNAGQYKAAYKQYQKAYTTAAQ